MNIKIRNIGISPAVLYGCHTWYFTQRVIWF